MTTEVAPGVFRFQVPVPFKLGHVNLYLVDTGSGFILVDTGVATAEAARCVHEGLKQVGIDYSEIAGIVVTHFHADHAGQAARLQQLSRAPIYMGKPDADYVQEFFRDGPPPEVDECLASHGVPARLATAFREILPALGRLMIPFAADVAAATGDRIGGGRTIVGVLTPGHTPGHLCLLLPEEGLLFAGDHILPHITPHIGLYSSADPSPVGSYLSSLQAVLGMAPRRILPAHGPPIEDPERRVRELLEHHRQRLARMAAATDPRGSTAWEVSRVVFGDDLDLVERWLAFFESLAHLEHLALEGTLRRVRDNSRIIYLSR